MRSDREPGWLPRHQIHALVLMAATVLGIYLCARLAAPFLPALTWSATLAALFAPFQAWLERRLRHPNLAASVAVFLIALIVVVPVVFVGRQIVLEMASGATAVEAAIASGEWRRAIEDQPRVEALAALIERHVDVPGLVTGATQWLSATAGSLVRGSVAQAIGFCLTFYLLFYLLRDRRAALRALAALAPLTEAEVDRLLARVNDTVHATVYGTLMVAAVQGTFGGLMFWWLGLPAPLLWGVVMALLAIVPVLGAFVIWAPAAALLALQGHWGKALLLAFWGVLVVGTIDNLLHPILVGNRLKLHTVLAFVAVVGGLMLVGSAGLILGPVVLTTTLVLLETWSRRPAGGDPTLPRDGTGT